MEYYNNTKTLIIHPEFNGELKDSPKETEIIIFKPTYVYFTFGRKKVILPKYFLIFPQSLKIIIFSHYFNQKVYNLPKNLTHLTFGFNFNQKISNLPKNLEYLKIGYPTKFEKQIILPKNLKKLSLNCNNNLINNIPKHIEKIYISFHYCLVEIIDNNNNNNNNIIKIDNLPPTIKKIVIENEKHKNYIKIPFGCIVSIKKIE
jgi:hypothetical protein